MDGSLLEVADSQLSADFDSIFQVPTIAISAPNESTEDSINDERNSIPLGQGPNRDLDRDLDHCISGENGENGLPGCSPSNFDDPTKL